MLHSIADEQDAIVHDVCSSHAMEIATCVAELDRMVASVEELRRAAAAGSEELQVRSVAFADLSGGTPCGAAAACALCEQHDRVCRRVWRCARLLSSLGP